MALIGIDNKGVSDLINALEYDINQQRQAGGPYKDMIRVQEALKDLTPENRNRLDPDIHIV